MAIEHFRSSKCPTRMGRKKGQNPGNLGGRPRNGLLERAAALVDYVAWTVELRKGGMRAIRDADLSRYARTTGRLRLRDARWLLFRVYRAVTDLAKYDFDSFWKAEKRYIERWEREGGRPFDLTLPDPPICTCEHYHCAGPCRTWARPPVPCERLISIDKPWFLPEPCRPSETICTCRHIHCEKCGVGISAEVPYDYIWPAHVNRVNLDGLVIEREFFGRLCQECTPARAKTPEPTDKELEANRAADRGRPRGCRYCPGDAVLEGDTYRCIGMSAREHQKLIAVRIKEAESVVMLSPTGPEPPEQQKAKREEVVARMKRVTGPLAPCGWTGKEEELRIQTWREDKTKRRKKGA